MAPSIWAKLSRPFRRQQLPQAQQPQLTERSFSSSVNKAFDKRTYVTGAGSSIVGGARSGTAELIVAYKRSPWLNAVVGKISWDIASMPWVLYRDTEGEVEPSVESFGNLRHTIPQSATLVPSHPLIDFLNRGSALLPGLSARKLSQIYLELKGEIYWMLERNQAGYPVEYLPVPPNWVTTQVDNGRLMYIVSNPSVADSIVVPAEDMLYFRDPDPAAPYAQGVGVGESLADEIDSDEYAAKLIKSRFVNHGVPGAVVSVDGADTETLEGLQKSFDSTHGGFRNYARNLFTSGKIDIKQMSQTFAELQMVDLRSWERDTFISVYGYPPELLGVLGNSNRATITEARKIRATEIQIPRMEFWRTWLQETLVPQFQREGELLYLSYVDPTPEMGEQRLAMIQSQPWAFTRGEIRAAVGLEHRGEIDEMHMVPMGVELQSVSAEVGEAVEQERKDAELGEEDLEEMQPDEEEQAEVEEEVDGEEETPEEERSAELVQQNAEDVIVARTLEDEAFTVIADQLNELPMLAVLEMLDEVAKLSSEDAYQELGKAFNFNERSERVKETIEELAAKDVKDIDDTTRETLTKIVAESVDEGKGVKDIARAIREKIPDMKRERAERIARTETVRASNISREESFKEIAEEDDVALGKEYVATMDGRVRPQHAAADEQVVPLDGEFSYGDGTKFTSPGNTGVAKHDVNCRCTFVAVELEEEEGEERSSPIVTRQLTDREMVWRRFDEQVEEWVSEYTEAVGDALEEQLEDVASKIEALGE